MKDFRKIATTLSPAFERLPYLARSQAAELRRRCDRHGVLIPGTELTDALVADLAFFVRAHPGEEQMLGSAVASLLAAGELAFEDGYLVVPGFAVEQRTDAADRMANKRARDAQSPEPLNANPDPQRDVSDGDSNSSQRDTSDERDVTPVTLAPARSDLVSSDLSEGSANKKKFTDKVRSPAGSPPASLPFQLPADWDPPPALVTALAAKHGVTEDRIRANVLEFRFYWREGKGAGKRCSARGWAQTFGSRADADAKSGSLYAEPRRTPNGAPGPARVPAPRQPNSGYSPAAAARDGGS